MAGNGAMGGMRLEQEEIDAIAEAVVAKLEGRLSAPNAEAVHGRREVSAAANRPTARVDGGPEEPPRMKWIGYRFCYADGSETTGKVVQLGPYYVAVFKGVRLPGPSFDSVAEAKAAVEAAWRRDSEGTAFVRGGTA